MKKRVQYKVQGNGLCLKHMKMEDLRFIPMPMFMLLLGGDEKIKNLLMGYCRKKYVPLTGF